MVDDNSKPMTLVSRVPLWLQMVAGLVLGALAGALLGERAAWLQPLGDLFINAITLYLLTTLVGLSEGELSAGVYNAAGKR